MKRKPVELTPRALAEAETHLQTLRAYLDSQRLSSAEAARKLGCSSTTVLKRLHELGLKTPYLGRMSVPARHAAFRVLNGRTRVEEVQSLLEAAVRTKKTRRKK